MIVIASTAVTLVPVLGAIRAPTVVAAGIVTLISASWLGEGIAQLQSGSSDEATLPVTGATVATIGAIVLIATGFWLGHARPRTALHWVAQLRHRQEPGLMEIRWAPDRGQSAASEGSAAGSHLSAGTFR